MRGAGDAHFMPVAAAVAKAPHVALGRVLVAQACVRREVGRHLGRGMRSEIGRRRATDQLRDADLPRDQTAAANLADANREIDAFVDDVHRPVRQLDVEAQLRMPAGELRDRRCQVSDTEADRACELQSPARNDRRGAHRFLGFLQIGHHITDRCRRQTCRFRS